MRWVVAVVMAVAVAGCLATENADFRSSDTLSGWGSSAGQHVRGSSTLDQTTPAKLR